MSQLTADVLIVGGGPVGLSAAVLLQRAGLSTIVVEQRRGPQSVPAAHVVNARTFEVWRQAGCDLDRILALAVDPADGGAVHWVTKLGGEVLGSLPFERQGDEVLELTPTPLRNLSQHRLEPLLVDDARRAGADVRFGQRWESSESVGDEVRSIVRAVDGEASTEVATRWLVACDGAGSPVRRSLGIEPVGPTRIQSFVMVHLAADFRHVVGEHPGVLYWVCDPETTGTFVAHDMDREWVFMHPWDPDVEAAEAFTPERCEAVVRAALADPTEPFTVRNVSTWTMTAQVAERYRAARIFLAGDAAHRFPPTGGLGLNTGVQDVHNLAWKLAAVTDGRGADALLDTYESERRPIAQRNAEQSLANALELVDVFTALGHDQDPEASRVRMESVLGSADGRAEVARAIADQATHFDMLGLQLGIDYQAADDAAVAGSVDDDDGVRCYRPSSRPGSRLPHGWVTRDGHRCSTLDLVPPTIPVLLVGPRAEGWDQVGLPVVRLGADVVDEGGWWTDVADMPSDGALLVRPDQHVAQRWLEMPADPAGALADSLRSLFGGEPSEAQWAPLRSV